MAVDINLFEEKTGWEGVVGGNVRLVKAMVLWVIVLCPQNCLHYFPNQLQATSAQVSSPTCLPSLPLRLAAWSALAQGLCHFPK